MKFRLNITFSHYGPKKPPYKNAVIDVSEFEGTPEEHHSGSFSVKLKVKKGGKQKLTDVLRKYMGKKDLWGECFTVSRKGVILFTEEDLF